MKRRQFITYLVWPTTSGWQHRSREPHRGWVRLIAMLSGAACMLSSHPSLAQDSQGKDSTSEQQAFNNACRTCHTIKEGDNRQGPNLHQIIGRKAGSLPDYNYSSAMKEAGFVWNKEKLERFIASPDEVVPGNSMKPYGGLASTDDRAKVIAYLQSVSTGRP